jgi:hypothetical protein
VDELEARVDPRLRSFDTGAVVEVEIDLDAVLGAVVVNHRADVGQADHRHFVVTDLDEDGRFLARAARTIASSLSWLSALKAPTAKCSRRERRIRSRARSILEMDVIAVA